MVFLDGVLVALEPGLGFSPWEPKPTEPNPGSDKPDRELTPAELRKLRRMISNRESARRSRMRKLRHLEGLRAHSSRLRAENRELQARLGGVAQHLTLFQLDNDRLRAEYAALRLRLSEIHRFLLACRLQRHRSAASARGTNSPCLQQSYT